MAPFPESEDMTIKRLMVALRKNDHQLLKMGTYKLHEKFHTGHDFELIDDLRQILDTMEQKQYPPEISDILCSTIRDILSKKAVQSLNPVLPSNSGKNVMPQALQPGGAQNDMQELAQMINSSEGADIKGFEEIKPVHAASSINQDVERQSSYQAPQNVPENTYYKAAQPSVQTVQMQNQAPQVQAPVQMQPQTVQQAVSYTQPVQQIPQPQPQVVQNVQYVGQAGQQVQPKEEEYAVKNIAVFYDDFKNDIDFANVKDYKNHLNFLFSKNQNGQDYNILKQISSLTHLLDTDTSDVDKVISMLTTSKGKVSFITASQSQNISKIFYEKNIDFDIPFVKKAQNKDAAFDLIPMNGSTNIFVCSNCNMRTLKTDFNTRTLSVQCPHCDGAAFPDIYAVNSYNPDCNPVFWHRAFSALVKSQIWILINPPLDENKEIIFDFIKTAYDASRPSKIYILSKENDKKEFYRQMFMSVNDKCTVKFNFSDQDKLCEEFINEEIIKKVFA